MTTVAILRPESGSFHTTRNGFLRGALDDVQFVGANTAKANTAIMPAHQVGDFIVVFAWNANNGTIPTAPFPPAGQPYWETIKTFNNSGRGLRVAGLHATSTTTLVSGWANCTDIAVAIYRNTKGAHATVALTSSTNSANIVYPAYADLNNRTQPYILRWAGHTGNTGASITPSGFTTRTSTAAIGGAAPGVALHDQLYAGSGTTLAAETETTSSNGSSVSLTLVLEAGVKGLSIDRADYTTTLNGDVYLRRLQVTSRDYNVGFNQHFTAYEKFFHVSGGAFTYSTGNLNALRSYLASFADRDFLIAGSSAEFRRDLRPIISTGAFAVSGAIVNYARGFFRNIVTASVTVTAGNVDSTHQAYLDAVRTDLSVDLDAVFKRDLIEVITSGGFNSTISQVGIRNDSPSPAGGGPFTLSETGQGGSDPSQASFLRFQHVKYNSVSKSRDLGLVSNFLGTFNGLIGSEVGSPTLFFKMTLVGAADLRITKNAQNRFTDQQVSIGILDSQRKQVKVNDFGFAYQNEIESTDLLEFQEPMPAGTYYFTVSTSQWQKIPYSVSIQAIRFNELDGAVVLTAALTSRFSVVKIPGVALLTGPFQSTIPTNESLKRATGHLLVSNGSRGTLLIPSGVAVCRMLPSGRLKMTHKISSKATLSSANVATLSAAPPSYGGYGP